jgi:hypothetical protein
MAASMRAVAGDHQPIDPPRPRAAVFADIPRAVALAAGDTEMAVLSTHTSEDRHTFMLRTVEDWPVSLVVEKTPHDPPGYTATAEVGYFEDRIARAEALINALAKRMEDIGRRRRFAQESD